MEMHFTDDLEQSESRRDHRQMLQELHLLAEFRALRICRLVWILFCLILACFTSIGQNHVPLSLYALIAYFFVYLFLSEYMKKRKTQAFFLQSLRLEYQYQDNKLLTDRSSFWFSFVLLAAIQYAFLHTLWLDSLLLTYAPAGFALLQLLLRYLGAALLQWKLKRKLLYRI